MAVTEKADVLKPTIFREMCQRINDKELREMVIAILSQYVDKIRTYPASLSGKYHDGATVESHLVRAFKFAKMFVEEFNLNQNDSDVLYASVLLHDIANLIFTTTERNPEEYQKLFQDKYNRDKESYKWHGVLGMFVVGKYVIDNKIVNPLIYKTALAISTHMSHWHSDCPQPKTDVEKFLCMSDYLASRNKDELV